MANSVFVVAPHHGYPVAPGGMPQVPLYPRSQPQVHLIPGNPPGLERSVCVQPAQRALKEGKTLGVSEISHCRLGATWLESEEGGGLEIQKFQTQQAGLELTQQAGLELTRPCQAQVYQKAQLCSITRAAVGGLILSNLVILGKMKKSNKKVIHGNIGWVVSIHADLCGLWKKMGSAIHKGESKHNVLKKNLCQRRTKAAG